MNRCLALMLAVALSSGGYRSVAAADAQPLKPVNLSLNTAGDETDPHLSSNGLMLLYAAQNKGKYGIMTSVRRAPSAAWPAGKPLLDLQEYGDCRSPYLTTDGRFPQQLFFASNWNPEKKDGKGDNYDIYFALKQFARADFTSPTPVHTVCTEADELFPWISLSAAGGQQLYFSRKDSDGWHLYVSSKPASGGQFAKPEQVELPVGFHHATLTPDGKTMYLQGPLEKERWGLFRTTRIKDAWSKPEPLAALNNSEGATGDQAPNLSRDGGLLYFASDRPGGKGGLDLWVIPTAQLKK